MSKQITRGFPMKKILLSLSAAMAVAYAGGASAADLVVKAPVMVSWTGCYVGVASGAALGRSRHVSGDAATNGLDITNTFNMSGGIVGIEFGCNVQRGNWVWGTESDFSWTSKRGGANNIAPFVTTSISSTREHWLSTSRLRFGVLPNERTLVYATGGLATARVEAIVDISATRGGVFSETRTRWGWTAGVGVETMLGNGWSAKADYLYVGLTDRGYFNPAPAGVAIRSNVPVNDHILRVGLNYKFTSCAFPIFGCVR